MTVESNFERQSQEKSMISSESAMGRGMKMGEEGDGSKDVQRVQISRSSYTKPRVLT